MQALDLAQALKFVASVCSPGLGKVTWSFLFLLDLPALF